MKSFNRQQVAGALFGLTQDLPLPAFDEVISEPPNRPFDIWARNSNEEWIVEVKLSTRFDSHLLRVLDQLELARGERNNVTLWLAILGEIRPTTRERIQERDILVSSLRDIEQLESILSSESSEIDT